VNASEAIDVHDERDGDRQPSGLLHLGRERLVRLFAIYAVLLIAVIAIPALMAQPRGASSHPNQQEVREAPGRAR
jgi:hypothetical protein